MNESRFYLIFILIIILAVSSIIYKYIKDKRIENAVDEMLKLRVKRNEMTTESNKAGVEMVQLLSLAIYKKEDISHISLLLQSYNELSTKINECQQVYNDLYQTAFAFQMVRGDFWSVLSETNFKNKLIKKLNSVQLVSLHDFSAIALQLQYKINNIEPIINT